MRNHPLLILVLLVSTVWTAPSFAESKSEPGVTTSPSTGGDGIKKFGKKIKSYFTAGTKTTVDGGETQEEAYSGPKAKIIIARVADKTGKRWYSNDLGDAMADQLATALVNSGRFIVLERQNFKALVEEQQLGQSGLAEAGTTPQFGKIKGAKLGVIAAITDIQGDVGGTQGGFGSGSSSLLSGILGSVKHSYIAMEIRLVNLESSEILASSSVEGKSSDINIAGVAGALTSSSGFGGALSSWKKTPLGKALRVLIRRAVKSISDKTPSQYFRHGGNIASSSSQPSQPSSGDQQVTQGDEKVKNVQLALQSHGHDVGIVDGVMGNKTRNAIKQFQTKHGIEPTGNLDINTIKLLKEKPTPVVQADSKILNIQKLLGALGYDVGTLDGTMNSLTKEAVEKFQSQNNLEITGTLNAETVKTLKDLSDALNSF